MTTLSGWVAILSPDLQSVASIKDLGPTPVEVKPARVKPLTVAVFPEFDEATQVVIGPSYAIGETVVQSYTVRSKTAAELDVDKEAKLDAVTMLLFEVNFDQENRIRTLEGKAAITKAQYRNALKARL